MSPIKLKVARIGNSRGIRLPANTLRRYGIGSAVLMEEKSDGILLRPSALFVEKLSWKETALEMTAAREDWRQWEITSGDGLEELSWEEKRPGRVAEKATSYKVKARRSRLRFKRNEIRWVALDPTQGAEIAGSRPAVIVSLDELNERLQTVTICPLTTQLHPAWRPRLRVDCGGRPAEIAVDQIRTISRLRLGKKIGSLSDDEASALRRLITEMYGE